MDQRLRVAMFTNVYRPTNNGVVTSVDSFRRGLTGLGHDVFLFAPESSGYEDVEPYIFRYKSVELPVQKYPLALPVSRFADRLLPRLKPHVLHANHPALLGHVAARKSQELEVPLVFTYHTRYREYAHYASLLPREFVQDFLQIWLAQFMLDCHQVVVPSESIRQMLKDEYGAEEGVSVVATGVDAEALRAGSHTAARHRLELEGRVLLSMGRLAKEKNFDLLLKAFAVVRQEFDDLTLLILGEGDEREALEELAAELGVADSVKLPGVVPHEKIPLYMAASDLFVFASVTETQGLVTLEAMAAGLPVVAVEASGTSDVIEDGISGRLTAVDPQALAKAVLEVLADSELRKRFAAEAQRRADEFSLENQALKMEAAYRQAIERHQAGETVISKRQQPSRWEELREFFTPARS